jgi:hypothetical protein
MFALYACTSVHITNHKFVLAHEAVVAHVQPFATAISVQVQVQEVIVHKVMIFVVQAHVDNAVFSTFERPTSAFTRVTAPVFPATLKTWSV